MNTFMSALVGALFGFAMSRIGFTSWDMVNGMFTFTDLTLLLAFMMSVMLLAGAWVILGRVQKKQRPMVPRGYHPGIIGGGVLFGAGWAVSGACPTIALSQIGEGQLAAVYTAAGIFVGNSIDSLVHERYFKWPASSCLDD